LTDLVEALDAAAVGFVVVEALCPELQAAARTAIAASDPTINELMSAELR
jgi:hypothetical protein